MSSTVRSNCYMTGQRFLLLSSPYFVNNFNILFGPLPEGVITAGRADDAGRAFWVSSFVVAPDWRNRGVGRALWERMWSVLQREGWLLGLSTTLDHPMRPFYERYGFKVVGLQSGIGARNTAWDYSRWQGTFCLSLCSWTMTNSTHIVSYLEQNINFIPSKL